VRAILSPATRARRFLIFSATTGASSSGALLGGFALDKIVY
jgi:hypothetical protein